MTRSPWRCWLGLVALFACTGIASAQQRVNFPFDVKTDIRFNIYFRAGPEIKRPTAPWYAYFPADPRMMPAPQTTPFPTWPQVFPPVADPKEFKKLSAEQMTGMPTQMYWPTASMQRTGDAIGYIPTQIPSYWRQTR